LSILKKIVKEVTKPIVNNHKGKVGEAKVDSKLNPLIFGKVEHKQINNLVLVDGLGKTHQIDHVEIRKNGIFCIETKNYKGWIFGSEKQDKWTQTLYTEKHQFLNPLKQNKSHIYHISNVLGSKYKINSVVVFVQNNADRIDIPNVINLNDLKRYLKDYNDGTIYSKDQIEEIYQSLINSGNKKISNREHVKNIKKTQKDLKEGICPRCGGKLVEKEGKYGKFYGCSNYPKCKFILKIK
jgi:hypothetical protein